MTRTVDELTNDTDDRLEDLELLAGNLRRAVVAVLSHAIRRQHLPGAFTFDSELWDRLRDLDGNGGCSAVSSEIERVQTLLRRGGAEMSNPANTDSLEPEDTDYLENDSVDWKRLFRDAARAAEPLVHLATAVEHGQHVDQGAIGEAANLLFWFVDAERRTRTQSTATGRSLFGDFPGIEVQE